MHENTVPEHTLTLEVTTLRAVHMPTKGRGNQKTKSSQFQSPILGSEKKKQKTPHIHTLRRNEAAVSRWQMSRLISSTFSSPGAIILPPVRRCITEEASLAARWACSLYDSAHYGASLCGKKVMVGRGCYCCLSIASHLKNNYHSYRLVIADMIWRSEESACAFCWVCKLI